MCGSFGLIEDADGVLLLEWQEKTFSRNKRTVILAAFVTLAFSVDVQPTAMRQHSQSVQLLAQS